MALGAGICLSSLSGNAQTLFTYGNHAVDKDEFLRVYQKNNNQQNLDYSEKSLNEYLNLYSLFRMKVQEAEDMGMDTTQAVLSELHNYRDQLAKTYLIDKDVTSKLVDEAYDRMKKDLHVAHILIAVRPNQDSLAGKATADSLYNLLIQNKADFATLAKQFSDDKSTADKGGDVGYITALQVVYPFENAAYNTAIGQISKPFRTQFGYHIIKVEGSRPDIGKVQVAQILIANPEYKGATGKKEAQAKLAEVRAKLKSGASFEDLVATYSDDNFSKNNKGVLEPFGVGKMTPAYEQAAFALKNPGDISEPITTEYGYHILKLVKKIPLQPLDSIRDEITRKVENDSRAAMAKDAYLEKVKKEYNFKEYPENVKVMLRVVGEDTAKAFKAEHYASLTNSLFEIGDKKYTQIGFLRYAESLTQGNLIGRRGSVLEDLYGMYKNKSLQDMQQEDLEKSNPEFRNLIAEYKNGIMLFDLMDKKVWSKATSDTTGLKNYYEKHQSKYQWQPGFEGTVYLSLNETDLSKVREYLSQGMEVQAAFDKVDNGNHKIAISQNTGRFEFGKFPLKPSDFTEGKPTKIFQNEDKSSGFVFVNKLHPQTEIKTMEDARGFVVADYQDYLEQEWNNSLQAKYPVSIKEKVLKKLVKK
jgi:peptidyl-prolyl cis-trans isomerase SurA